MSFSKTDLQKEISYKASRSGGKGGQNVNKVSTKVELLFDTDASAFLSDEQKQLLKEKLHSRLNRDGFVQVISDEERSQYLNKEKAVEKLYNILIKALQKPKVRKATKVSKAAKAARLDQKRINSERKQSRKKNFGW